MSALVAMTGGKYVAEDVVKNLYIFLHFQGTCAVCRTCLARDCTRRVTSRVAPLSVLITTRSLGNGNSRVTSDQHNT